MKGKKIKKCIYQNKGVTLVALMITIIVLLILTSVTIAVAYEEFNSLKLKDFFTKLEIAQSGVEKIVEINEQYKDENENIVYLKELGTLPTSDHILLIQSLGFSSENFRYFTAEQVVTQLEIAGIDMDLLIDFENKKIINPKGIKIDGETYYMLINQQYSVNANEDKNVAEVDFDYAVERYGAGSYKIKVTPINVGDIKEGIVKYKKSDLNYWIVANDNEIIVNELTSYDIIYVDTNNNSNKKTITLSLDNDGNVNSTE